MSAPPENYGRQTARVRILGGVVLAGLALVLAAGGGQHLLLQTAWFDACQTLFPRQVETSPATIVQIDDRSLARFGRWPWPRTLLAQLIHTISGAQPAAIGIDIVMPEPDPLSPDVLLPRIDVSGALSDLLGELPSNDKELANALASAPTVLIVAGSRGAAVIPLHAAPIVVRDERASAVSAAHAVSRLIEFPGAMASLPILDNAASGWGFGSADDHSGVLRRVPLVANVNGTLAPALPVEMWRIALHAPAVRIATARGEVKGVAVGNRYFPTEADGRARIWFSHRDPSRFVSAIDVLEGRVDPARFAHKFVLIGVTAAALGDYLWTPVGDKMAGSEIHAQLLENMYDGTLLVRPSWAPLAEAAVFLLLGALLVWAVPRWPMRYAALVALACILAPPSAALPVFSADRLQFDAATPVLGLLVLFGTTIATSLTLSRKAHQKAVYMFSRFVNPNVVRELLKDDSFAKGGQSRELTILFSDIRNFTAMSEKRSPAEVVSLLNEYFTRQVEIVFRYHGALDKFIGDGVMAFWGAPLDDTEHARHAVDCALGIVESLDAFRTDMGIRDGDFDIGIGLHTGRAVVGLIGSETRREYTAIGAAVNLASRIEGLTKVAKRRVLVTRETMEKCGEAFAFDYVGAFAIKGVERDVQVYEPRPQRPEFEA